MKKVGMAICAMLAFGAIASSAAAYEGPEWEAAGHNVTTSRGVQSTFVITLKDLKTVVGEAAVKCEGSFIGTIGVEGKDETTEALNTAGEKISAEKPLLCTSVKGCTGTAEVTPLGLPWKTQLEGTETGFLDDITSASEMGFKVVCTILGVKVTDECRQALASATVENMLSEAGNDLLANINEENSSNCTQGGEHSGDFIAEQLVASTESVEIAALRCIVSAPALYLTEQKCLDESGAGNFANGYEDMF
jgi:hypothetical protein